MDSTLLQGSGLEALPQFLTSLAIGLLIGLERERTPSARAGLRTFALVAIFGTLTALLASKLELPWLMIAGLVAVTVMIVAAYIHNPGVVLQASPSQERQEGENDPGTTTVIALLLSYVLGALVWYGSAKLAVTLAVGITALLYFKPELRGLSQRLSRRDLVAVLQFSVLTFIVLPILPNQDYGPYNALNPHQIWLMVVLISGLSLAGYAAMHAVGTRYGAPLLGFLGGLVSSTATTLIYARNSKNNAAMTRLSAAVIVIASIVVLLRLIAISSIVAYDILPGLLPALLGGLILGLLVAVYNWRKLRNATELYLPETSNPAELHTAISFGLLYVAILLGSAWMRDISGSHGLYAVSLVSGLTDVDAITLSSLRLHKLGQLSETQAVTSIALAILSNLAFKFGMVAFVGGRALARQVALGFGAIACGVLAGLLAL